MKMSKLIIKELHERVEFLSKHRDYMWGRFNVEFNEKERLLRELSSMRRDENKKMEELKSKIEKLEKENKKLKARNYRLKNDVKYLKIQLED